MIETLLIANRGEIARRIIRTARLMGVRTIAVFSDADEDMPFVREADLAVPIGPAPARESYLVPEKILVAAKFTGADAIHPGYGFLSENAGFARAVIQAGYKWVGPPPEAIEAMGLKDAAKRLMAEAGVPVTPGYLGDDQNAERLELEAGKIGFPVLIKAVAGGGGKGMRRVDDPGHFAAALESCRREAAASFGDDRVLIEKYVTRPRHIEVQVFADKHGNAVHLFERDCSLQRRHQKVIEEAPAPGMNAATRAAVCEAAVRAAKAVNYEGAGTVEFIADASEGLRPDRIWFMEMNTRLQVEHPVTEMVTGFDLVEWQLRVASGEPLPARQDEITLQGHAIEARLYAENPSSGFLPSIGRLEHLRLPESVRVDSAVGEGDVVSPHYDPMIAKLIAHGETRDQAAAMLAEACAETEVYPVRTNAGFLARCLWHPDFQDGKVDTGFIEARLDDLIPVPPPRDALGSAVLLRLEEFVGADYKPDIWEPAPTRLFGFRLNQTHASAVRLPLVVDGRPRRLEVGVRRPGPLRPFEWDIELDGQPFVGSATATVMGDEPYLVFSDGDPVEVTFKPVSATAGEEAGNDGAIRSPMPGRIVAVLTAVGDRVSKGQPLLTLEAMKMEHTLIAPFDGEVEELDAAAGGQTVEGAVLARVAPRIAGS
jgi:acetyl/propionyl-CoA carboxylase alpha subunit